MIIFFGVRRSQREPVGVGVKCPGCKENGMLIIPVVNYFHVMFIPFFPLYKSYLPFCPHCQGTFPNALGEISPEIKKEVKTPIWTFSGLIIIGLIFLIPFIAAIFR